MYIGSLLPKYRGAAPIQWAVLNGDKKTGITTMYMEEGMDTGDMIKKEEVEITREDTTKTMFEKLAIVGKNILLETLKMIETLEIKNTKSTLLSKVVEKSIEFNDKKVEMKAGDTLFIEKRERHRVAYTSENPCCIWFCVHF